MITSFEHSKIVDILFLIREDPRSVTNGEIGDLCDDDELVSLIQRYKDHSKVAIEVLEEIVRILSNEQENRDSMS